MRSFYNTFLPLFNLNSTQNKVAFWVRFCLFLLTFLVCVYAKEFSSSPLRTEIGHCLLLPSFPSFETFHSSTHFFLTWKSLTLFICPSFLREKMLSQASFARRRKDLEDKQTKVLTEYFAWSLASSFRTFLVIRLELRFQRNWFSSNISKIQCFGYD